MTKVLRAAAAADIVESFMRGCNCHERPAFITAATSALANARQNTNITTTHALSPYHTTLALLQAPHHACFASCWPLARAVPSRTFLSHLRGLSGLV